MGLLKELRGAGGGAGAGVLLLPLLLLHRAGGEGLESRRAPWFDTEPPPLVQYAAERGVRVSCAARGVPPPSVTWLAPDGARLHDHPPHRRVYSNGTLEVSDARESAELAVRCRAANAHGVAVSRLVTLRAVRGGERVVTASAAPAAAGGVAALTCRAEPASPPDLPAPPPRWYRDDTPLHFTPPHPESRYVAAGEVLLIRDVSLADAGAYSCETPRSTAAPARRSPPVHLALTEWVGGGAPRLASAGGARLVSAGEEFCLPCAAADHPPPHYTWYRGGEGRLHAVEGGTDAWLWARGAALCVRAASPRHAGLWLCKAYSARGEATAHHRLEVREPLLVTVSPATLRVPAGGAAVLRCTASDTRAALAWLHDGAPAGAGPELAVQRAQRHHAGLYQCFARRAHDEAHASAELQLGESPPELVYTFIEQALRAGGSVTLRCAAAGAPPPTLAWLLDGAPLDSYRTRHRYSVSEQAVAGGDVVSVLNVTDVTAADGGRYTCRATNALGTADHSARLDIYGPPAVRALGPVRLVAGENATLYCPYSGYPISEVSWRFRGGSVPVRGGGGARVQARGNALLLTPALPPDAGHYACVVTAPPHPPVSADIEIQVRNPPKISPFMFSSDLTEGSSAQVLCGVSSGDKPMYFTWLKDGAPLPASLQVEEKSLNEFSLLMFSELSARHSGAYTCRVSNHAATVNYTATLTVNVSPAWSTEPLDAAVVVGAPLRLECAATGHPAPHVRWHRRIGEGRGAGEEGEQWEAMGGTLDAAHGAGTLHAEHGAGTLYAAHATRAHAGLYRCTADNGVPPPLVKHVNLTVYEPAHLEAGDENVSSVAGHSVALTCTARGDEPLSVRWTRRGTALDLHSYRWSVSEARAGTALRSTLTVVAAARGDGGEYRCLARNPHGAAERALRLRVEESPPAPRTPRLAALGTRWARVAWRAPPAPALRYSALCTRLPAREPQYAAINLTLHAETDAVDRAGGAGGWMRVCAYVGDLRPGGTYSVRLVAHNHVGDSPYSEPLLLTTLEEAPSAAPQNVRARSIDSEELLVSWSAPPPESLNGELLGYVVSWHEASAGGGESGRCTTGGGGAGELPVSGLRGGVRYSLSVRAYTRAGAGPPSPTVSATTAEGAPQTAPSSVACEAVSASSLRVRWSPPPGATRALRGYDVHYVPLDLSPAESEEGAGGTRAGVGGEVTLQGLAPATNYSVWVRARSDAGPGPPAAPAHCSTSRDGAGAVDTVRALPAGADALRVTWLPAVHHAAVTYYTLYARELGRAGGAWAQRVEAGGAGQEVWRDVRPLRPALYELWVAAGGRFPGPPSRPVTAAPALPGPARVSSVCHAVTVRAGTLVRLPCAAVGAPPLHRRWAPLPPGHTLTDTGDLLLHKVSVHESGNYTCSVRNAGGADTCVHVVLVVGAPPAPPAPRLVRASRRALRLAWRAPPDSGTPLTGYTVQWSHEGGGEGQAGAVRVPPTDTTLAVARLACGARYSITLRAHNAAGDSPPSSPLVATTTGDRAVAAPGREFVWANSSALRLNLVSWRTWCPVVQWAVAVRAAGGSGSWRELRTDGESALAGALLPAAWYEVRVVARSSAGDTAALYRAPTRATTGETIGEAVEVGSHGVSGAADAANAADGVGAWRVAGALVGGAVLLAALACSARALVRRAGARARPAALLPPHCHQLYSAEPNNKIDGKNLPPPDGDAEISPYATFSMGGGGAACGVQLCTFGHAEGAELAAAPPRPNQLVSAPALEWGSGGRRGRESDSSSSGSPCAACAASVYRAPAAPSGACRRAGSAPTESSAEDTSYGAPHCPARAHARGVHNRHATHPTPRSQLAATAATRSERAYRHVL